MTEINLTEEQIQYIANGVIDAIAYEDGETIDSEDHCYVALRMSRLKETVRDYFSTFKGSK